MNKKTLTPLLSLIILNSCSLMNPLIGYENAFEWHQDSYIGKSIDEYILENGTRYKTGSIKVNKNQGIETHTTTYDYYSYKDNKKHECTIQKDIDSKTRIITAWRYAGAKGECLRGYFYEGVW